MTWPLAAGRPRRSSLLVSPKAPGSGLCLRMICYSPPTKARSGMHAGNAHAEAKLNGGLIGGDVACKVVHAVVRPSLYGKSMSYRPSGSQGSLSSRAGATRMPASYTRVLLAV